MKRIASILAICLSLGVGSVWADIVDWNQLGPPSTVLPSPQIWDSLSGQTGVVGVVGGGSFERVDQGFDWNGNFSTGSALIWNQGNGDFLFLFNTPLSGSSMAVQGDAYESVYGNTHRLRQWYECVGHNHIGDPPITSWGPRRSSRSIRTLRTSALCELVSSIRKAQTAELNAQ